MANDIDFGEIKKVNIREIWKHEQYDFTPWLAEEDNANKLAECLGLEFKVEGVEVSVGPYSADMLAKDSSGQYVIIENQYGKTNHDHLGKLITYSSFLGAGIIIWIAECFTEEHQRAIDWLNDNTNEDLSFYGVMLELWQIDNSRPSLRFNVVSHPTITKQANLVKRNISSSTLGMTRLEFWTMFRECLLAQKIVPSAQTAKPKSSFDITLGRTDIYLSALCNHSDNRIGVRLCVRLENSEDAINQLLQKKDYIESKIGEKLLWNPNPDNKHKTIDIYKDINFDDKSKWPQYCDWMVSQVAKFRETFIPIIKQLDIE